MTRVMLLTFAVLGWAWFEMSGGTDFVPGENGVQVIAAVAPRSADDKAARTAAESTQEVVTRDLTADLNSVERPGIAELAATQAIAVEPEKLAALTTPVVMTDAILVAEPAVVRVPEAAPVDYRQVSGSRVNLRGGPSTSFDVVTQLLRGEEVEVLEANAEGWVKLRALDGSDIGWMAERFLTARN